MTTGEISGAIPRQPQRRRLFAGDRVTIIVDPISDPIIVVMRPHMIVTRVETDAAGNFVHFVAVPDFRTDPSAIEYGPYPDPRLLTGWISR